MADYQGFKIPIFTGINDVPRLPTSEEGGNISHFYDEYNKLIDLLQADVSTIETNTTNLTTSFTELDTRLTTTEAETAKIPTIETNITELTTNLATTDDKAINADSNANFAVTTVQSIRDIDLVNIQNSIDTLNSNTINADTINIINLRLDTLDSYTAFTRNMANEIINLVSDVGAYSNIEIITPISTDPEETYYFGKVGRKNREGKIVRVDVFIPSGSLADIQEIYLNSDPLGNGIYDDLNWVKEDYQLLLDNNHLAFFFPSLSETLPINTDLYLEALGQLSNLTVLVYLL